MNVLTNFNFCNYLAEGNIACHTTAATRNEIIEKLSARLAYTTARLNKEKINDAIIEREDVFPSVVAPGLAIPHARFEEIDTLTIAIATSPSGIDFAPGMDPVKVVIMILTPVNDPGLHVQVLSAVAKILCVPDALEKILSIPTPNGILNYFADSNMEIPPYLKVRDLMNSAPLTLLESDTLAKAIAVVSTEKVEEIPILDEDGDLRGIISGNEILRFSLPEHLLWLNDLSPIMRFGPFVEILKNSQDTKLADLMCEQYETIEADAPAIQLIKMFIVSKVKQLIVVNNGKFCGIAERDKVIRDLFWA